jgi:hypothetical protein
MIPSAAGFKLTSDRGFKYYNQTSSNSKFEIDTTGNLNLKNNDINNAGAITTEQLFTEQFGDSVHTVGPDPRNNYQSLAAAFSDLSGTVSASDRATIVMTGNLVGSDEETTHIEALSHVDVVGNGYRVEVNATGPTNEAVTCNGIQDSTWQNITIDHRPATLPGRSQVFWLAQGSEENFVLDTVIAIANQNGNEKAHGFMARHRSHPTLQNCLAVAGPANGSMAFLLIHACYPELHDCVGYAGAGYGSTGFRIHDSASPLLSSCTGYSGLDAGSYGFDLDNSCEPTVEGCVGTVRKFSGFQNLNGTSSVGVIEGVTDQNDDSPIAVDPSAVFLQTMNINVVDAISGATIDIETTQGGTEIAAGVPADTAGRKNFAVNNTDFNPGDTFYFTTDSGVQFRPRYVLTASHNSNYGLFLRTRGNADISDSYFFGGDTSAGGALGGSASARNWSLSNTTFRTDRFNAAFDGLSGSDNYDPIYNCTFLRYGGGSGATNVSFPDKEVGGIVTFSGDGSTTGFYIDHGLPAQPSRWTAEEVSGDAGTAGINRVTNTGDGRLRVDFETAPVSGTENIKLAWSATP